VNTILQSSPLN